MKSTKTTSFRSLSSSLSPPQSPHLSSPPLSPPSSSSSESTSNQTFIPRKLRHPTILIYLNGDVRVREMVDDPRRTKFSKILLNSNSSWIKYSENYENIILYDKDKKIVESTDITIPKYVRYGKIVHVTPDEYVYFMDDNTQYLMKRHVSSVVNTRLSIIPLQSYIEIQLKKPSTGPLYIEFDSPLKGNIEYIRNIYFTPIKSKATKEKIFKKNLQSGDIEGTLTTYTPRERKSKGYIENKTDRLNKSEVFSTRTGSPTLFGIDPSVNACTVQCKEHIYINNILDNSIKSNLVFINKTSPFKVNRFDSRNQISYASREMNRSSEAEDTQYRRNNKDRYSNTTKKDKGKKKGHKYKIPTIEMEAVNVQKQSVSYKTTETGYFTTGSLIKYVILDNIIDGDSKFGVSTLARLRINSADPFVHRMSFPGNWNIYIKNKLHGMQNMKPLPISEWNGEFVFKVNNNDFQYDVISSVNTIKVERKDILDVNQQPYLLNEKITGKNAFIGSTFKLIQRDIASTSTVSKDTGTTKDKVPPNRVDYLITHIKLTIVPETHSNLDDNVIFIIFPLYKNYMFTKSIDKPDNHTEMMSSNILSNWIVEKAPVFIDVISYTKVNILEKMALWGYDSSEIESVASIRVSCNSSKLDAVTLGLSYVSIIESDTTIVQ